MKRKKANITGPFPTTKILYVLWNGCNGTWIDNKWFSKKILRAYNICLDYKLIDENPRLKGDKEHFGWFTNDKGIRYLAQYHKRRLME